MESKGLLICSHAKQLQLPEVSRQSCLSSTTDTVQGIWGGNSFGWLVEKSEKKPCQDGISAEILSGFQKKFLSQPQYRLAQNVCRHNDLDDICLSSSAVSDVNHVFNCKVAEVKPITNQKASGRCWIFACLNAMRIPFMKKYELDDFEFSENYLFFWDKLERCNYNLESYITSAHKGEKAEGRLIDHLLKSPSEDGGQWDMLINLVTKYGIVPKSCFNETYSGENTYRLRSLLNNKMREFCKTLQESVEKGFSDKDIENLKTDMLEKIYYILSVSLGSPPEKITWEYYDKNKTYHSEGPLSPIDFYNHLVKPYYNLQDKICIVNDPRSKNPYSKLYTVEYLNNMTGGQPVLYINQPVHVLKELAIKSLQDGEPVWFGCDVGKHFCRKMGMLDINMHDYGMVFGVDKGGLNKASRLIYGDSLMTHAMLLTGVNHEDGKTIRWRVENSWGDENGDKGYILMKDSWFAEFVYEVVIDKKYIPADVLAIYSQTPVVLPAWDPIGALARDCFC